MAERKFRPISSIISIGLLILIVYLEIRGILFLKENISKIQNNGLSFIEFFTVLIPNVTSIVIATIVCLFNLRPCSKAKNNLTPILRILGLITYILNLIILLFNILLIVMFSTGNDGFFEWLSKVLQSVPVEEIV